jgi:hypothetical protein
MRDLRDELVALLKEGASRGEFEVADSELAALAILGAIRMTAVVGNPSGASARRLSDLLLGGLGRRVARPSLNLVEQRRAAGGTQ